MFVVVGVCCVGVGVCVGVCVGGWWMGCVVFVPVWCYIYIYYIWLFQYMRDEGVLIMVAMWYSSVFSTKNCFSFVTCCLVCLIGSELTHVTLMQAIL